MKRIATALRNKIEVCMMCKTIKHKRNIVIGRGDETKAKYLFIGEAPGHSEDLLKEAFIGPSGQLLNEIIERSQIDLKDCYFTNTIFCRPVDERSGLDREPMKSEVIQCMPFVKKIINIVCPECVVFVGKFSEKVYKKYFKEKGIKTVTIIHPAAILRSGKESMVQYNMVLLRRIKNEGN